MRVEVVLTFRDEDGALREVEVASRRFTIGRGADNDLVIAAPGVARRHAVIESFDGGVLVYDCQSGQGTLLNNAPVRGSATLRGGDLLTLGGSCDITVKLRAPLESTPSAKAGRPDPAPPRVPSNSDTHPQSAHLSPRAKSSGAPSVEKGWLHIGVPVAALILIILVGGFFLLPSTRQPTIEERSTRDNQYNSAPSETPSAVAPGVGGAAPAANGEEELERAASRVVQSLSGDGRAYGARFPPEALRDIGRQIEQYRQSSDLREAFAAMQRDARGVATQARAEGVPPGLVIYAALAASDRGRDASATARALIPQLRDLRTTFGGDTADGGLLVVAAYTYGVGSKKTHPLLATMRASSRGDPFGRRNVWHLRARGGLSDEAYNLVVRTLAVGVIAQDPRGHGVQAEPLVY